MMLKLLPLAYSAIMLSLLLLPASFFNQVSTQVPVEMSGLKTEHWVHMLLFFGFVLSWLLARYSPRSVLVLTVSAAVSTEILQGFVGRYPDVQDLLFNLTGMALAYVLWRVGEAMRSRLTQNPGK